MKIERTFLPNAKIHRLVQVNINLCDTFSISHFSKNVNENLKRQQIQADLFAANKKAEAHPRAMPPPKI